MNTITVDARGLACPEPVVRARKALLRPGADAVEVLVTDEAAIENIGRMAAGLGWNARVDARPDGALIELRRPADAPPADTATAAAIVPQAAAAPQTPRATVLVSSDTIGRGDDELGRVLMRAFIKTLAELDPLPSLVIFLNGGVRLTTEGSTLLDDLRRLVDAGVRVWSCATCLDYFHLLDRLRVGERSNMYEIASALVAAERVVRP